MNGDGTGAAWWLDVLRFVDDEGERISAAFEDIRLTRPTEYKALLALWRRARGPAARLREVRPYMVYPFKTVKRREAKAIRIAEVNAWWSDLAARLPEYTPRTVNDWTPDEDDIRRRMTALERPCAGCGRDIVGRFDLCAECYRAYGNQRDAWPDWLHEEARRVRQQQRRDAINDLYGEVRLNAIVGKDESGLVELGELIPAPLPLPTLLDDSAPVDYGGGPPPAYTVTLSVLFLDCTALSREYWIILRAYIEQRLAQHGGQPYTSDQAAALAESLGLARVTPANYRQLASRLVKHLGYDPFVTIQVLALGLPLF